MTAARVTAVTFQRVAVKSQEMAARKPPSRAMLDLCARANDLGAATYPDGWRVIKPRDVERWSQYGLLPDVERPGRGRGRGRAPVYTDEFLARLVEVAALVRREHSQARAALALFTRGRPPREEVLRKAYLEELERLETGLTKAARRGQKDVATNHRPGHVPETLTPDDYADLAEPTIAAMLKRKEGGGSAELQATANLLGRVLLGGEVTLAAVTETLMGLGVPSRLVTSGESQPDVSQVLASLSMENLRSVAENASMEELEQDLATVRALVTVVDSAAREHITDLQGTRAMGLVDGPSEVAPAIGALNVGVLRRASRTQESDTI